MCLKMSEKNADQIKTLYTELAKIAPSQDWERILKLAKKSTQQEEEQQRQNKKKRSIFQF